MIRIGRIFSVVRAFVAELRRRRVFRVAVVYAVAAWLIIQVANNVFPALLLPSWFARAVIVLVLLGFPISLLLSWAYHIRPDEGKPAVRDAERRATVGAGGAPAGGVTPAPAAPPRSMVVATGAVRAKAGGPPTRPAPAVPPEPAEAAPPDPERVKRASLAQVRHDLRTPINAILGYSEMLLEDATERNTEGVAADLRRIHAAGKQLLSIVEEILEPEKIATGRIEEDLHEYRSRLQHALRTPINAVVGYAELLMESCRDAGRDELLPDLGRIREAAQRLLATVESVAVAPAGPREGAGLRIDLSGPSTLAEEVLAKIAPVEPERIHGVQVDEGYVLIVDDNGLNRDLLSRQLARQGYTVATAENGRQALKLMESQDFDVVLLDIMMPEMDGIETLRRLKQDPKLREVPVIMISALDEVDSVVRCIELGAEDYLSKPFDPVLLRARVGTILELGRLRSREEALADRLRREQETLEQLLPGLFPRSIGARVRASEKNILESFPEATVLCCAVEGFGRLTAHGGAAEAVAVRNQIFAAFDRLAEKHGIETIKTTADHYLAVAGVPTPRQDHAQTIAEMALAMLDAMRSSTGEQHDSLRIQIGIHTGPVMAGVLGAERPSYEVWGDVVDTACRLEAAGAPWSIQVSPAAYARLRDAYAFKSRGVVDVPGRGQMRAYLLQGRIEP